MLKSICTLGFILVARTAAADVCHLDVSATDQMRFEQSTLEVGGQCTEVELTLHNVGKLPANVMGHDWVLAKSADMAAVANAGMGAGFANNYQKPDDKRIVAATKIIGGGETSVIKFATARLESGVSYTYFCSAPGHYSIMKGKFVYNAGGAAAMAQNESK